MRFPGPHRASVLLGAAFVGAAFGYACGFDGVAAGADDDGGARSRVEAGAEDAAQDAATIGDAADASDASDASGPYRQPTLLLWLDASDPAGDGTKPADMTPLAAWVDKARARSVTQPMAARRALFRTSSIAGKPALQFDGKDDFFDVDLDINGTLLPDLTVVAVFQSAPGNTSAYAGVWGHDNGGWDRFVAAGGGANLNGVSNGTGFTPITGFTATGVPLITSIVMHGNGAGQSHAYVGGVLSATFSGSLNPGEKHMSVGNLNGPAVFGATWAFDGAIAEVLVYGSALTDPVREAIEASLKAKYTP